MRTGELVAGGEPKVTLDRHILPMGRCHPHGVLLSGTGIPIWPEEGPRLHGGQQRFNEWHSGELPDTAGDWLKPERKPVSAPGQKGWDGGGFAKTMASAFYCPQGGGPGWRGPSPRPELFGPESSFRSGARHLRGSGQRDLQPNVKASEGEGAVAGHQGWGGVLARVDGGGRRCHACSRWGRKRRAEPVRTWKCGMEAWAAGP